MKNSKTIETAVKFINSGEEVFTCNATISGNHEIFSGEWDTLKTAGDNFMSFVLDSDAPEIIEMFRDSHHDSIPYSFQFLTEDNRVIEIKEASMVQWTEANTGRKADRIPGHRGSLCPTDMFNGRGYSYNEKAELQKKFETYGA